MHLHYSSIWLLAANLIAATGRIHVRAQSTAAAAAASSAGAAAPSILADPGRGGVVPEIVHLYYDEWPTGIAVSKSGRKFSNYPPFLDPNDTKYTVAELTGNTTETPYPSAQINSPPGGRINYTTYPPTSANYQNYFIGVQSVVIDPADRLWVLDTGRVTTPNGTMLEASYGGPKLIGIDLTTNKIFKTIIFSTTAAPSDSYLNDVRFDLTPGLTQSGQGVAYITDSSPEGRNAIVIVDLGTGQAWRHLQNVPSVQATAGFVPIVWGQAVYVNGTPGAFATNVNFGADGIALSADGKTLFFSTTGGRNLYSILTSRLLDRSINSEILARGAVQFLTEKGLSDGLEIDSNNILYGGSIESNSIFSYDPAVGVLSQFSRDPRYSWSDTFSTGADGYLYYTENQLWRGPSYNGGVERRVKPYVLFRAKLPNGGKKVQQPAPRAQGPGAGNATMMLREEVHYE